MAKARSTHHQSKSASVETIVLDFDLEALNEVDCGDQQDGRRQGMQGQAGVAEGMRRCAGCKQVKRLDEFGTNRSNVRGRQYLCPECHRAEARIYREKLREKYDASERNGADAAKAEGFFTVREMAKDANRSRRTIRDRLRKAEMKGRLERRGVYYSHYEIGGVGRTVPAYRVMPKKETP